MREYISKIAPLMREYERFQMASDRWCENSNALLTRFDRHCATNFPESDALSEEMLEWCNKRDTESNNSCCSRIYPIVGFVRFLQKRGMTHVNPPTIPRKERRAYVPHAFTPEELKNFFAACDMIISRPYTSALVSQNLNLTIPVFFRLLYSSGIRTNEARLLRKDDADLSHGVLNIRYSKGHDQHFVVLHDSMLKLMREYDAAIGNLYPGRLYFFPGRSGECRSNSWVCSNFKKLWEKGNNSYAVAYELRHNYAVTNVNSWTDDCIGFNQKLYSLSKSMGHSVIESTNYYYSLVPRMANILDEHTDEDEVIPEVCYES